MGYHGCLAPIMQMKLSKLKVTLEEVRSQKAQLEGQLTHAETKVADLRERLEQREVRGFW